MYVVRIEKGMLFLFDTDEQRAFWMKNCLIALDMVWLDSEFRVVDISRDVQPCKADPCPGYDSKVPARYVLELKGGLAKKLNLQIGDKIFLPFD